MKIKESAVFLNFFTKYKFYLLLPALTGGFLAYLLAIKQPTTFQASSFLEMDYKLGEVKNLQLLADEAVAVLRSPQQNQQLGIGSQVTAFKIGPLSIGLRVNNLDQEQAAQDNQKLQSLVKEKFPLNQIGSQTLDVKYANIFFYILSGISFGFFCGLIITLIKSYLEKY